MIRVGLLGATGRMGQYVARILAEEFADKATLVASAGEGQPLAPLLEADVVIDFSLPEAMLALTREALAHPGALPAFVVGSTGWKIEAKREVEKLAEKTPVLMSSNFSTGVGALLEILRKASPLLDKLGYTPVLVETHHIHKKDAPSGTALSIQRAISVAPGNVQTHTIRGGEIIGDHEVTFYGKADHITIGHFAQDRSLFARGAIETALWLASKRAAGGAAGKLIGMEAFFKERFA